MVYVGIKVRSISRYFFICWVIVYETFIYFLVNFVSFEDLPCYKEKKNGVLGFYVSVSLFTVLSYSGQSHPDAVLKSTHDSIKFSYHLVFVMSLGDKLKWSPNTMTSHTPYTPLPYFLFCHSLTWVDGLHFVSSYLFVCYLASSLFWPQQTNFSQVYTVPFSDSSSLCPMNLFLH